MSLYDLFGTQAGKLNHRIWELKQQYAQLAGAALQYALIEFAAEHETITGYELDANYEYDDEGGYYFSASIRAFFKEGLDEEKQDELQDLLFDAAHDWASQDACAVAFDTDGWTAEITVEELKAQAPTDPPPIDDEGDILERAIVDARVLDKLNLLFSAKTWPGALALEDVCSMIRSTGRIEVEGASRWESH